MLRNWTVAVNLFLIASFFGTPTAIFGIPTAMLRGDETETNFRSRALANGEYLLLAPNTNNTAATAVTNPQNPVGPNGAAGGASMADFGMLMNLIQTTVDPDLWESGDATMQAYPGGIYLDADGVVRRCKINPKLSNAISVDEPVAQAGWQQLAKRRVVSLKRLLQAVNDAQQKGLAWNREIATLAGLHRIDFVLLDKENADLLLLGPAGGEIRIENGAWISAVTQTSPVLLQDVLAICNAFDNDQTPTVLCSLDPTQEGIARIHALLSKPNAAAQLTRNPARGMEELSQTLGMHQVSISGLDPASPTALALLEADIHMKRLGLGLEVPPNGLMNYPDWAEKLGLQPSGQLLRWWFTPDYPEIQCNAEQTLFAFPNRRVRLESERQRMDAAGNRNVDALKDEAADKFAQQFTTEFSAIQQKYPLYGRLSHIFDIAIACKLAKENSPWNSRYSITKIADAPVPKEVASTTATGTWKNKGQAHKWIVISGGVLLDFNRFEIKAKLTSTSSSAVPTNLVNSQPEREALPYWWWDTSANADNQ
jgi:hypothetical protein